jgi:Domain of unknown function (DUF4129)
MRAFGVRFSLFILLSGILILWGSAPVFASQVRQAITPEQFWQRVDETIIVVRRLKSQPEKDVPQALDQLADQWAQLDSVNFPDGSTAALDTGFFVAEIRRRPYELDKLLDIFGALQDAHKTGPTRRFSAADTAAIQTILQRPEFQWDRPPSPLQEWWDALWKKINAWLNSVFGKGGISLPIPTDAFTIVASILLAFVLVYVFRGLFADLVVETRLDEDHVAGDEFLTAETALQKAKEISKAGDYRTAVRYLYLSSLLLLDERGLLRFDRSKTNREYLRSVSAFPHLSAPLREVIDVFDRVWYGFQPIGQDDFQHYVEKVDQLREQKK